MAGYSSKIALLGGCIDYAGTFPPAALPLSEALKTAASWRKSSRLPWLMARVALPLSDITHLSAKTLYDSGADGSTWLFAALGTPETDPEAYSKTLEWDLREVKRCNERGFDSSCRQWIVSYESKPPVETVSDLRTFLFRGMNRFLNRELGRLDPYIEISFEGEWEKRFHSIAEILAEWCDESSESGIVPGIKVRTGGKIVPSARQLATAITATLSHGLRFKATQGLHDAVTHGPHFGFVNLFSALTLFQVLGSEKFGPALVEGCLSDGEKKNFRFEPNAIVWKEFRVETDSIEAARRRHAGVFGSCSLDEPEASLLSTFP